MDSFELFAGDNDDSSKEDEEELDKKMGDLGDGQTDTLDERMWGDDEDDDEEEGSDKEEESGQGMDQVQTTVTAGLLNKTHLKQKDIKISYFHALKHIHLSYCSVNLILITQMSPLLCHYLLSTLDSLRVSQSWWLRMTIWMLQTPTRTRKNKTKMNRSMTRRKKKSMNKEMR